MALSKEENDALTQVGPGKPAGELLRRYWQPIGFANELQGKPKRKRILGEDVVLFRDENGKFGVLALRCMHRGTSLEFGHIENGGLRCCYHGWLYDVDGKVLERRARERRAHSKIACASRLIKFKISAACCSSTWGRSRRRCCRATTCWFAKTASGRCARASSIATISR